MDPSLVEIIRVKVSAFRIADAKEVLTQLRLPKHGRKDELNARILSIFQDAATLTAQGHTLRDQGRVDAAAAMVDTIFQRLVRADYGPAIAAASKLWQNHRHTAGMESSGSAGQAGAAAAAPAAGAAAAAAAGGSGGGEDAPAQQHPPNKRLRVSTLIPPRPQFRVPRADGAAAGAAAGAAVHSDPVDEVITAFMNGEDGIGLTNTKVRCVCSQHIAREPMLQCEGAFCGVWQHAQCVKQLLMHAPPLHLPGVHGSDKWPQRRQFLCERCRVARADPFWEVYDTLVMPPQQGKMTGARMVVNLQTPGQSAEWTVSRAGPAKITLSSQQLRLLQQSPQEYQLQALGLCLEDSVQFRTQWPTAPMLRLGSRALRVNSRMASAQLGPMQRDFPANLTPLLPHFGVQEHGGLCVDLSLEFADPQRSFLLLAYIMRRRTKEQVKALMKPPESLAAALQRVRLFMNPRGSRASSNNNPAAAAAAQQQQHQPPAAAAAAAQDDDAEVISDGDDDIVVGNRVVSLKDPNTFMRINQPARFTDTCGNDLLAFDLDTFLDMADTTLKWIDPHSMKASCVQNLQVDTYLAQVLVGLARQPDVLEVEINTEGDWRPAGSSGPFVSVLAAGAAAAAGGGGAAAGGVGSDDDDDKEEEEEEDELAELRRAASEMRRGKQHEVIELLDSDDEDDEQQPPPPQQQLAGAGGGGGLQIYLPNRAQQQQQLLQQQPTAGMAGAAAAAAAAVGPSVPHLAAGGVGTHMQGGGGAGGGVMSPRVVSAAAANVHHPQQLQQQQQYPQPFLQQQQQQPLGMGMSMDPLQTYGSGDVLLQQQQQQQQQQQLHNAGGFVGSGALLQQQSGPPSQGSTQFGQMPFHLVQSGQQYYLPVAVSAGRLQQLTSPLGGSGQQQFSSDRAVVTGGVLMQQQQQQPQQPLQQQLSLQGSLPQGIVGGEGPLPPQQPGQYQQQPQFPGQVVYMQQQQQPQLHHQHQHHL